MRWWLADVLGHPNACGHAYLRRVTDPRPYRPLAAAANQTKRPRLTIDSRVGLPQVSPVNDDLKQWLVRGWPAAGLTLASALGAAPATLSGWRGNGTGCFPDAHPPTQWERISPVMKGLRCQARKPSRPEVSGTPAYCGAVAEWLVLGPLPAEGEKPVEQEILPDEANLTPDEGEKVQGVPWTRRTPENGIVD